MHTRNKQKMQCFLSLRDAHMTRLSLYGIAFIHSSAMNMRTYTRHHPLNRYKEPDKGKQIKNVTSRDICMNIARCMTYVIVKRIPINARLFWADFVLCNIYVENLYICAMCCYGRVDTCVCDKMSRVVDI